MTLVQTRRMVIDLPLVAAAVEQTDIDDIIDALQHIGPYLAGWELVSDEIRLTLYSGFVDSEQLSELPARWMVDVCYVWYDMDNEVAPIYRGDDPSPPKNDRWEVHEAMRLDLYFKSEEVGIPMDWTRRMRRRRHARDSHQTQ